MKISEDSFVKAEPVIAAHGAASVVAYTLGLLVTHGVVSHTQASALTEQVVPAVAAGLTIGLGVLVRRFVTPVWKKVSPLTAKAAPLLADLGSLDILPDAPQNS